MPYFHFAQKIDKMNQLFFKRKAGLLAIPMALSILLPACSHNPADVAAKWTKDIKNKIIEDASKTPDKTVFDSAHQQLTLFKDGKKLKQVFFAKRENADESEKAIYDTAMIVLYSDDQNFQLIKEPCTPKSERTYEGVAYKGNRMGFAEYQYCKKIFRETGFHYNNLNVGPWTEYDSTGKAIETKDMGNADKLNTLEDIRYAR